MIAFECPACRESVSFQDDLAGAKVTCPKCGGAVDVPGVPTLAPLDLDRAGAESAAQFRAGVPGEATGSWHSAEFESADPSQELYDFLAPAQEPDEIGRLGPFRVLKILGAGGMGVVYKAEDPQLKRLVALKAMLPTLAASESARRRFLREAQAAAAIVHDHIVRILQTGEDRGVPFLAMQFLEGESLEDRLKREPRLAVAEVCRIGRETAAGLAAAHQQGMMHRDIKPANLWLESRGAISAEDPGGPHHSPLTTHHSTTHHSTTHHSPGRVKILDFGLARAAIDDAHLTQSGIILGTPAYMAPEQAAGEKVDPRCDLFSLGCVLYRLSTGTLPFRGKDAISTLVAVATQNPKPPATLYPEVPLSLSNLVMQLLAKDREDRPESAHAVVEAIQGIEEQLADAGALPGNRSRWPWLVGGAALGLGIAMALAFLFLWPGAPPVADVAVVPAAASLSKNNLGMEFVLVPRGKAWLGGGAGKPGSREVEITYDFYLGKYEVTQQEWLRVMGNTPSYFRDGVGIPLDILKRFPVENVTWNDAQQFVAKLNAMDSWPDWVYRLPKEVEWEYACRGGPMTDRADSAFDYYLAAPTNQLLPAEANMQGSKGRPTPVGSYPPNRLGLHDMHGNVWEWCDDADPISQRVVRGGSWNSGAPSTLRAASRDVLGAGFARQPSQRFNDYGLRLARVPVAEKSLNPPPAFADSSVHDIGTDGLTLTGRIAATDPIAVTFTTLGGVVSRLRAKQFLVRLAAGIKYRMTMDSKQFDSLLMVLDQDGTPLKWDDNSGGGLNALLYMEVASEQVVKLVAASVKGEGEFTLKVKEAEPTETGAGLVKFEGALGKVKALTYPVKLHAGKTYVIDMISANNKTLDPFLRLLDAAGQRLAEDDDGGDANNARIRFKPRETDTYQIVATHFKDLNQGQFTLTVREDAAKGTVLVTPFRDADSWVLKGPELHQTDTAAGHTILFGDPAWTNYDFDVEAQTRAGNGECHVAFRATAPQNLLYLALGGFGNAQHALVGKEAGDPRPVVTHVMVASKTEPNRWYKIRVSARANDFKVLLDGKQILEFASGKRPRGCVGVGTVGTSACFRNPLVTGPDGKILLNGWPPDLLKGKTKPPPEK